MLLYNVFGIWFWKRLISLKMNYNYDFHNTIVMEFEKLNNDFFMNIANSAFKAAHEGRCYNQQKNQNIVLVNLSSPDIMIYNPIVLPGEYKHQTFDIGEDKELLVIVGND